MALLAHACSAIDWCRAAEIVSNVLLKVSGIIFEAAVTVCFAVLVGLGALGARRWLHDKQQQRLHALALCRRRGVKLRNDGLVKDFDKPEFEKWKKDIEKWKADLFDTATEFSPVEAERLDTLDWMPAKTFQDITKPKQIRLLQDATETLKRLQQLLEDRVRPIFTP